MGRLSIRKGGFVVGVQGLLDEDHGSLRLMVTKLVLLMLE